jgi:hypothetical protein
MRQAAIVIVMTAAQLFSGAPNMTDSVSLLLDELPRLVIRSRNRKAKPARNGTGEKDVFAKGKVYDSVQNVDRDSASRRARRASSSKHFGHKVVAAILQLFVPMRFLPVWKLDFFTLKLFIWNKTQEMRNAVEPGSPLVISVDDVPWRI